VGTKRIAIMTGGGDVPGLNAVIKGVVYRGSEMGFDVLGIRRGWEGLTHVDLEDAKSRERYLAPLSRESTRTIDRSGGTWLHTSRTNPAKMASVPAHLEAARFPKKEIVKRGETLSVYDVTDQVLKNLELLEIDYLIAVGGDDTLSYAAALSSRGVNVIAIPKTMDNDVRNTEYCIGCSTAMTRATAAIQRQRTTVGSHERIGVFRIFGRDSGYTALYTAYVTAIRCAIPEHPFNLEKMIELLLKDKRDNPSNYSLVVLSEGASWEGYTVREAGRRDAYGHAKKVNVGEAFSEELGRRGEETVLSDLTYDLRSGEPDFIDKMVAITFANMAVDCVIEGKSGLMTGIVDGCYAMAPIPDPKLGPRKIDVATMYNVDRYRPNYANKLGLPLFLTRA
jgi:ATP-dependent phosphofructokinase / diphosphate-dependent phosphofructokinase